MTPIAVSADAAPTRIERDAMAFAAAVLFARLGLAATFLSAVLHRAGVWGTPPLEHSAWGSFAGLAAYTGQMELAVQASVTPTLAWIATGLQLALGLFLLLGLWPRGTALAAGVVLLLSAVAFSLASDSPRNALDGGMFVMAGAAFLLAALPQRVAVPQTHRTEPRLRYVSPL